MPKAAIKRAYRTAKPIKEGFEIPDSHFKGWIVGEVIGKGGFGCLYAASSKDDPKTKKYVLKIEPQENGPLFTETHFYTRVCKQNLLEEWKSLHQLAFLGVPRFISKGVFKTPDRTSCRFLVMDRFHSSLEDSLSNSELSLIDIPPIAIQVLDALEYIHSKDYVHADIKASNLLRMDTYNFYLVDFGLATLYRIDGKHKPEKANPKLRDNGTLEFCSRDAHAGLPPSRRGDIEILLYNLVHWLYRTRPNAEQGSCAGLPWNALIGNTAIRVNVPKQVRDRLIVSKIEAMDPSKASILVNAVGLGRLPALESLIRAVGALGYEEAPDYSRLKELLRSLKTNLTTHNPALQHTSVLAEVNSRETRSPRRRKAETKAESPTTKTSAKRTPKSTVALKKSRIQNVVEVVGTSHQSDDEEAQKPASTGQKQADNAPLRRSARNRHPVINIFDSSEEDNETDSEYVSAARRLPTKKTRRNHFGGEIRSKAVHGIATQTSPGLLRQL